MAPLFFAHANKFLPRRVTYALYTLKMIPAGKGQLKQSI